VSKSILEHPSSQREIFVAFVTLGGQASETVSRRPMSIQTYGVPREVCEDFDFAFAREEIKK
jgi:hypothetical protein